MNETTRLLQAYLDGELHAEARREVEARLASDVALRGELNALREVWGAVDELPTPTAGSEIWKGVEAGLRARKRQQIMPWTATQKIAAAAAMVAGIVVGFGMAGQPAGSDLVTDVATSGVAETVVDENELLTLDAMWLQLGSVDEDSES